MTLIQIRIFDDNDFMPEVRSALACISSECRTYINEKYPSLGYDGVEIRLHKVANDKDFDTCTKICQRGLDGISIFDFKFDRVNISASRKLADNLLALDTKSQSSDWESYLSGNPGYVLACVAAVAKENTADIYIGTTNSELRDSCEQQLRVLLQDNQLQDNQRTFTVGQERCALDQGILSFQRNPLIRKLKELIDSYIKKRRSEPPPPPEQAIADFFDWRRTDPTATTSKLHELDNVDLPTFKKHSAYEALRGLLRLTELELDGVLVLDGCQRALLEALKGMGANDDKLINQQCSTFGLFLIAWSAFRVRNTQINSFQDALKSFSKNWEQCKGVAKSHPVTQGVNSTSAVLSAFFLFLELATDHDKRTTNQIVCVSLDKHGFEISFKLVANAFDDFKSTVEKEFSVMHASFERKGQTSTNVAGSLTSKALIHLMMEVGCRQALFGGDQRAEMSVQWKNSDGVLVIKFAPRMV